MKVAHQSYKKPKIISKTISESDSESAAKKPSNIIDDIFKSKKQ